MKMILTCALAATAFATFGCASPETSTDPGERLEREYATGSNIPRKSKAGTADGVQVYDKEAVERARSTAPQAPPAPMGGGGGPR